MAAPAKFDGSEDQLHEDASRASGLSNFGTSYLPALRVLLSSMDADPRFTPAGRELAWDALVLTLMSRAFAEEGWKRYPEWQGTVIRKPLVITGLPRTGTTALHKLLGVDPQFQGVENWLSLAPMPRPPRHLWAEQTGFRRAMEWLSKQHAESPDSAISHHVAADELDECLELQRQTFISNRWASTWYSPSYDAWWTTQDEGPSFRRAWDLLKLIGCQDQQRTWLLKNPGTIGMFEWLFECAPDACVIQTHRDPVKAVASIASTVQHIHHAFEGVEAGRSQRVLGPRELEKWAAMLDRGYAHRTCREAQFLDVHHAAFHQQPMGVIGQIYDRFGFHLSAEVEARMGDQIKSSSEAYVQHCYDLSDFGLSAEMIRERHADYISRHGPF
jgi:hypothetical protein